MADSSDPPDALSEPPRCSFCGQLGTKLPSESGAEGKVVRLVAARELFICELCVRLCNEILDEDDARRSGGGLPAR